MSALKRHIPSCSAHMSAFGGKADMTLFGNPLLRWVKRTSLFAPHMSAFDPKRTLVRRGTRLTDLRGVQF